MQRASVPSFLFVWEDWRDLVAASPLPSRRLPLSKRWSWDGWLGKRRKLILERTSVLSCSADEGQTVSELAAQVVKLLEVCTVDSNDDLVCCLRQLFQEVIFAWEALRLVAEVGRRK